MPFRNQIVKCTFLDCGLTGLFNELYYIHEGLFFPTPQGIISLTIMLLTHDFIVSTSEAFCGFTGDKP